MNVNDAGAELLNLLLAFLIYPGLLVGLLVSLIFLLLYCPLSHFFYIMPRRAIPKTGEGDFEASGNSRASEDITPDIRSESFSPLWLIRAVACLVLFVLLPFPANPASKILPADLLIIVPFLFVPLALRLPWLPQHSSITEKKSANSLNFWPVVYALIIIVVSFTVAYQSNSFLLNEIGTPLAWWGWRTQLIRLCGGIACLLALSGGNFDLLSWEKSSPSISPSGVASESISITPLLPFYLFRLIVSAELAAQLAWIITLFVPMNIFTTLSGYLAIPFFYGVIIVAYILVLALRALLRLDAVSPLTFLCLGPGRIGLSPLLFVFLALVLTTINSFTYF